MPIRPALFVGFALLAVPVGFLLHGWAGVVGFSTAAAACSVMAVTASWPMSRRHLHHIALVVGGLSIAITVWVVVGGIAIYGAGINIGPVEMIALYLMLAAVARWTSPLRSAVVAGSVLWVACVLWVLRLIQYSPPADPPFDPPLGSVEGVFIVLGHLAASAFFPTLALIAGGGPRYLAHRRHELIAAARREQRIELAQDLHDYVAHDLTGIVAQAQAAQFARADDLEHLRGALGRIEQVGLAALDAMEGFVHVLHDQDAAPRSMGQIQEIAALVARFRTERGPAAPVRLDLEPAARAQASRAVQATAYRVVVEGLTNVRRHASPDSPVTVSVGAAPDGTLSVEVRNELDNGGGPLDGRLRTRGGTGLATLEERVSAVGGHLDAGPDGSGGWRLTAHLPTSNQEGAS